MKDLFPIEQSSISEMELLKTEYGGDPKQIPKETLIQSILSGWVDDDVSSPTHTTSIISMIVSQRCLEALVSLGFQLHTKDFLYVAQNAEFDEYVQLNEHERRGGFMAI